MMRSWQYAAAGVLFTLVAGFVARRLIMAQYSFGGRFFAVALWVILAGAASAGVVAFASARRPYMLGLFTGILAIMLTGIVLFWRQASLFWVLTALVVATLAGTIGAFLGITLRWLLGGSTGSPTSGSGGSGGPGGSGGSGPRLGPGPSPGPGPGPGPSQGPGTGTGPLRV